MQLIQLLKYCLNFFSFLPGTMFINRINKWIYIYIYIYKLLKNLSERGFWCIISAWFFHENSPYVTLYQLTKFQCHIFFPSGDIKQKVLLSSYLDKVDVIKFTIYLESSSKPMADREKLRRSRKSKNLNISRTKRASYMK